MAEKKYVIDNAELMAEWNWEKNDKLGFDPKTLTLGNNKKAWWKCSKGHAWQASVFHRNKGNGCPFCSGRYAIKGENDLQTVNPALACEWNYEKNNGLTPAEVMPNSNKKVWWKCSKGHEWQTTVNNRSNGNKCPICNSERHTSFPEYAIVYYLKKYRVATIHSYKEKGYELDIYIPSKNVAIEYDGYFWHKNKTQEDLEKNRKCKRDGIILYRIREGLPPLNDYSIDYVVQEIKKDLPQTLKDALSEIIGTDVDVDLEKDTVDIENLREHTEKESSLLFSNPEIAKEWNYKKNGNLSPEHFLAYSNKKVWWICSKGHEWQASIADRTSGNGCPYCSSNMLLRGYNDLQTLNPALANEWNYEKNNDLTPLDVMPNSNKKVWWKCEKGHEWEALIINRNRGRDCPICSNKKILKGYNDLQTLHPILASEWNYEKNGQLTPMDVGPNSHNKVWWRCSEGHEWYAAIYSRNAGVGCPCCSGKLVNKGKNDLQTLNPALANEWNYEKNDGLTPMDVMPNSGKKVWWICNEGHEWQAIIQNRNRGSGCPQCAKEKRKKKT
ncbi:MAG: zinc-ribbon domain-containing protein [Clostridia bacterium]|nr:zinc-ribbon domain-containing protein [Clostridia bacterium]